MMGMLQALPKTALWARLEQEGRLIQEDAGASTNQPAELQTHPTDPRHRQRIRGGLLRLV